MKCPKCGGTEFWRAEVVLWSDKFDLAKVVCQSDGIFEERPLQAMERIEEEGRDRELVPTGHLIEEGPWPHRGIPKKTSLECAQCDYWMDSIPCQSERREGDS